MVSRFVKAVSFTTFRFESSKKQHQLGKAVEGSVRAISFPGG